MTNNRMGHMEPTTASYLASTLDCEGYIGVTHLKTDDSYRPYIGFTNSDMPLLKFVSEHTGLSIRPRKGSPLTKKQAYVIETRAGYKIQELLEQLIPFLISKKAVAKVMLELASLRAQRRLVRNAKTGQYCSRPPSEREIELCKMLYVGR